MSNELHDLLDRGAAAPSSDVDVDALVRSARGRHHRRVGVLAAAVVALVAVVGGAVVLAQPSSTVSIPTRPAGQATTVPDGWNEITLHDENLSFAIPPEWTKVRTFGDEVVTVGTSDLQRYGFLTVCGEPNGFQLPPVPGTWISLFEYRDLGPNDEVPLRLNSGLHVKVSNLGPRPADLRDAARTMSSCGAATTPLSAPSVSLYGGEYHTVVFADAGRVFVATIVIKEPFGTEDVDVAYQVLNSLRVGELAATVPTTTVTVPPTSAPQPPTAPPTAPVAATGDEADIRSVFLAWLDAQDRNAMDGIVEDYASIAATHLEGMHQHSEADLAKYTGRVDSVTITDSSHADVRYTALFDGRPQYSMVPGQAIKIDGKWMVTRETVCNLLKNGGLTCPPRA